MIEKKYEELTFNDDFMFCKVLQDNPELCKELLELIIGEPIGDLLIVEKQHAIEITPGSRGVRFDVCAKDDASIVYDVEMQNAMKDHLPKRARYASSLIDLDMLERGSKFHELCRSYVIFICRFNLMPEAGMHRYSFRNICAENRKLELGDETEKIFLCTEGDADDVSDEMKQFLAYVADGSIEGEFAVKLHKAVEIARRNPRWRKEYMDFQDYIDDAIALGIERGREEGIEQGRAEEHKETEKALEREAQALERAAQAEATLKNALEHIKDLEEKLKN